MAALDLQSHAFHHADRRMCRANKFPGDIASAALETCRSHHTVMHSFAPSRHLLISPLPHSLSGDPAIAQVWRTHAEFFRRAQLHCLVDECHLYSGPRPGTIYFDVYADPCMCVWMGACSVCGGQGFSLLTMLLIRLLGLQAFG